MVKLGRYLVQSIHSPLQLFSPSPYPRKILFLPHIFLTKNILIHLITNWIPRIRWLFCLFTDDRHRGVFEEVRERPKFTSTPPGKTVIFQPERKNKSLRFHFAAQKKYSPPQSDFEKKGPAPPPISILEKSRCPLPQIHTAKTTSFWRFILENCQKMRGPKTFRKNSW